MKYALAHGEDFTRLRIRVSPSEIKQLQTACVIKRVPALYRVVNGTPTVIQERCTILSVGDRSAPIVKVVNGWHEVNLERTTLLSKDPNHKWLRVALGGITRVLEEAQSPIPAEYRQVFIEPSDILYRRQRHPLRVRGWGRHASVTYLLTKVHQMRSMIEDTVDYKPPVDLPPASAESLSTLLNHYQ